MSASARFPPAVLLGSAARAGASVPRLDRGRGGPWPLVDNAFAGDDLSEPVAMPSNEDYLHVVMKRGIAIGLAQSMEAVGENRIVRAYQEPGPLQQRVLQYMSGQRWIA